ncbi:acyltransferase family protein, partial [Enterococcus faecalis]
ANFAFANKMNFDLLNETGVPWYFLSLASFYLITIFLQRVQPKIMLAIIVVIGCASGYLPVEDFLSLRRTLGFFPFFYCGYL